MHPAPPPPPPARARNDEVPPPLVVVAGVLGWIACVVHALLALPLWYLATGFVQRRFLPVVAVDGAGVTADVTVTVVAALLGLGVAGGLPVALGVGASRLMSGRGRGLLVAASLPVAAVVLWLLADVLTAGSGPTGLLLVLAGPALTPVVALLPSVGRWVARGDSPRLPRSSSARLG